jgi:hypothetical protein
MGFGLIIKVCVQIRIMQPGENFGQEAAARSKDGPCSIIFVWMNNKKMGARYYKKPKFHIT